MEVDTTVENNDEVKRRKEVVGCVTLVRNRIWLVLVTIDRQLTAASPTASAPPIAALDRYREHTSIDPDIPSTVHRKKLDIDSLLVLLSYLF